MEPEFITALKTCQRYSKNAIENTTDQKDKFISLLSNLIHHTESILIKNLNQKKETEIEHIATFKEHVKELKKTLLLIQNQMCDDFSISFMNLGKYSKSLNIILFGKTMAGKSTTMAALTQANANEIGLQSQHTTTKIQEYYFPKKNKLLKIIDTPGVEGFEGDKLAEMAASCIDFADHIFLLFTDDKQTPSELSWINRIKPMGKSITILINYKTKESRLSRGCAYIYRSSQEHEEHIKQLLTKEFGISECPQIIHYHAHAALLYKTEPESLKKVAQSQLLEISRINEIESRIRDIVTEAAVHLKIKSPRDLLRGYQYESKDLLRPFIGQFRVLDKNLNELKDIMMRKVEDLVQYGEKTIGSFDNTFNKIINEFNSILDDAIQNKKGGKYLKIEYQNMLKIFEVKNLPNKFAEELKNRFVETIEVDLLEMKIKSPENKKFKSSFNADGIDELKKYDKAKRFGRAGVKSATTAIGSGLAIWAVSNFWNPTGWVAALGLGAVAIIGGTIGKKGGDFVTDEWKKYDKQTVQKTRSKIIESLKSDLLKNYKNNIISDCNSWQKDFLTELKLSIDDLLLPFIKFSNACHRTILEFLISVDFIIRDMDKCMFQDIFELVFAESDTGIQIKKMIYEPELLACKIVCSFNKKCTLSDFQGKNWKNISKIKQLFGIKFLSFINQSDSVSSQICQGLCLKEIYTEKIKQNDGNGYCIYLPDNKIAGAIGFKGSNVNLTKRLLKIRDIKIIRENNLF